MKVSIKDLKKNDVFQFNNTLHYVSQKYSDWKKNGEPYLKTKCNQIFWFDELQVEKLDKKNLHK